MSETEGRLPLLEYRREHSAPDGKRLASSACDPFEKGEVRLWETAELIKK